MKSKYFLAEQVRLKLEGGYGKTASKVQFDDIKAALGQKINTKFRTEQFSINLPSGETIPDNLFLAEYEDIPVNGGKGKAEALLPIIPISLPRNMGVYAIKDETNCEFIPMQAGQDTLMFGQKILSDFMKQVGYTVQGQKIKFTYDITINGIEKINAVLVVMDLDKYDDFTPLPIPASMESEIVEELFVDFAIVMGIHLKKKVDNYNPEAN